MTTTETSGAIQIQRLVKEYRPGQPVLKSLLKNKKVTFIVHLHLSPSP